MENKDVTHLQWIHDRMVHVHGENKNYDYMIKFRSIIESTHDVSKEVVREAIIASYDYLARLGYFTDPTREGKRVMTLLDKAKGIVNEAEKHDVSKEVYSKEDVKNAIYYAYDYGKMEWDFEQAEEAIFKSLTHDVSKEQTK